MRDDQPIFSWTAPEYSHGDKSHSWFLSVALVGGAGIIFSVIMGNFLFAIFLALALFLLFVYHVRAPREIEVSVMRRGIVIHNRLFEYAYLQSFWVFEHENGESELSLISKKTLMPHIKVSLGDTDPDEVRDALKDLLPEEHQEESLIDVLARQIGL